MAVEVLLGCWQEAERASAVAALLRAVRAAPAGAAVLLGSGSGNGSAHGAEAAALEKQLQDASRLLRDLYDLLPIYGARVALVHRPLHVLLPCLQRTLHDMKMLVGAEGAAAAAAGGRGRGGAAAVVDWAARWEAMYRRLSVEGDMLLVSRFVMYNNYLVQLIRLLSKPSMFDRGAMELCRTKILRLRSTRGIPQPMALITAGPTAPDEPTLQSRGERIAEHWAERVFDGIQPATRLRHLGPSKCFGSSMPDSRLGVTPESTVLFKHPFDNNALSVTVCLLPGNEDIVRLLCRWVDSQRLPAWSSYGVHEICIERKGSALQFKRWSATAGRATPWLALFYKCWEKMVLFHCTFAALKARCPLTRAVKREEYILGGEDMLFQGKIRDDGFDHRLTVFEDRSCRGLRLHASVYDGELNYCPVWTAFVTHESTSSSWLRRHSARRVRLRDMRPYVFCANYRWRHQRKKGGEFEICFAKEEAADSFVAVFDPHSPLGSSSSSAATSEIAVGPFASGGLI